MIVSVSDMLKILDKIPVWKTLVELPKRITALEERLAALEKTPAPQIERGEQCPHCRGQMKVIKEVDSRLLAGRAGIKERTLRCESCDVTTDRNWSAAKGYL